ncbi:hypothetical protein ATANTOWER_020909 [Ataeniobius toweri]|uniref:Uncharacterized protein n=1 Tax=Ataeniobius toweri TaxID=208326 RepID=A0ABU7AYX1_9TELE|nr:hypothetical protein [Ataeniobius toweri]
MHGENSRHAPVFNLWILLMLLMLMILFGSEFVYNDLTVPISSSIQEAGVPRKTPGWKSNRGPSFCKATVLPTAPASSRRKFSLAQNYLYA